MLRQAPLGNNIPDLSYLVVNVETDEYPVNTGLQSSLNKPAYIVAALRTPIGKLGRSLKDVQIHQLVAPLIVELLKRHHIPVTAIDEVVLGNAAGPGGNPARVAALAAGLPVNIPGVTVDRQCGSGLEAIHYAARLIQCGAAEIVLAGGAESASTAPLRVSRRDRRFYQRARFAPDFMDDPDMGIAAENVAVRFGISRYEQDCLAFASHQNAALAEAAGLLSAERLPIADVAIDECVRADCTLEALSALPPVFLESGTVTAGNACPINDGAAMLLMTSHRPDVAVTGNSRVLEFIDASAAGVEPRLLGSGPIPATRKLLQRSGISMDAVDAVEFNEAFAAQVLASVHELEIPMDKVNRRGGALAIGHPYGASGALLVTRLLHQLEIGQTGLATIGIGGGMGLSALFRAV